MRTEIIELRSPHAKWFRLPSGARQVELSLKWPIHHLDADGHWQDCDSTLRPDSSASGYGLSSKGGWSSVTRLGKRAGSPVRLERGGCRLSLRPQGVADVAGVVTANRLTFENAWPDADLAWFAVPEGLRKELLLKSPLAPSSYSFLLKADALEVLPNQDGSLYAWSGPFPAFEVLRPWCHDANGIPGPVTLTLRTEGGQTYLDLSLDPAWLADPARAYPVVADPVVIQPDAAAGKDTYASEGAPTTNYATAADLYSGCISPAGWRHRSFIEFALSAYAGSTLTAAPLELYFHGDYDATDRTIGVHKATAAWVETTLTWNAQPAYDAGATASDIADTPPTWLSWDILAFVAAILAGTATNYGLALINADEATVGSRKGFRSSDHATQGERPKLTLTFTQPTATGTDPTGTLVAPGTVTDDVSPLLTWSTTGAPQTKSQVRVYTADGATLVKDTGEVTSAVKEYQCANGLLLYGVAYRWQVRVQSAFSDWSAYSGWQYFTCVLSAPVGLTATPHAADAHIDLAWTAHGGEGFYGFKVWRKPSGGADSEYRRQSPSILAGTAWTDEATGSGVAYTYAVSAVTTSLHESARSAAVEGTTTFAGFRLGTLAVKLAEPARPTATRVVTQKRRTDGSRRIEDRGYGPRELDLRLAFRTLAEEAAIKALFATPGAVVGYRDELGQSLRGQLVGDIGSDGFRVRANAGFLDLTLTEVTPT